MQFLLYFPCLYFNDANLLSPQYCSLSCWQLTKDQLTAFFLIICSVDTTEAEIVAEHMAGDISDCVRTKEAVFVKRLFFGWAALHILICVSVLVFYTIEGGHEEKHIEDTREAWKVAEVFKTELVARVSEGDFNITSDDIESVINLHLTAKSLGSKNEDIKWTLIRTFSFTHEYLSTIGFGQVVPQTVAGKS